jgi:NAD(P)-dependent dehydrogenase (short-subunit alcohol dehydrogenase family)
VFATNITGAFLCAREAVRRMSTRHGGRGGAIVNVSSMASRLGSPGEYVDYAASKGAIDSLTIGLAREVADEGIRVNAVRPGVIYTEIHASGGDPGRVVARPRCHEARQPSRRGARDPVARLIFHRDVRRDVSGGLHGYRRQPPRRRRRHRLQSAAEEALTWEMYEARRQPRRRDRRSVRAIPSPRLAGDVHHGNDLGFPHRPPQGGMRPCFDSCGR